MRTALLPVALALLAFPVLSEEYLPTPYTAEQIRYALLEGFEVMIRTRSAAGESYSLMRVVAWTEERFSMVEAEVDAEGRQVSGTELDVHSGSWQQLRDHARFAASRASRERAEWDTPLGRLEGWLYLVEGEEGVTEFFFADDLPGPPVVYRRQGEGLDGFVAEQTSRGVHPVR